MFYTPNFLPRPKNLTIFASDIIIFASIDLKKTQRKQRSFTECCCAICQLSSRNMKSILRIRNKFSIYSNSIPIFFVCIRLIFHFILSNLKFRRTFQSQIPGQSVCVGCVRNEFVRNESPSQFSRKKTKNSSLYYQIKILTEIQTGMYKYLRMSCLPRLSREKTIKLQMSLAFFIFSSFFIIMSVVHNYYFFCFVHSV